MNRAGCTSQLFELAEKHKEKQGKLHGTQKAQRISEGERTQIEAKTSNYAEHKAINQRPSPSGFIKYKS